MPFDGRPLASGKRFDFKLFERRLRRTTDDGHKGKQDYEPHGNL